MFNSWSLKRKLITAFCGTSFALLAVGLVGFYTSTQITKYYKHVVDVNFANSRSLGDMEVAAWRIRAFSNRLALATTHEEIEKVEANLTASTKEYAEGDKAYFAIPFVEGEDAKYKIMNEKFKIFAGHLAELSRLGNRKSPGDQEKFMALLAGPFRDASNEHLEALQNLSDFQTEESIKWKSQSESAATNGNITSGLTILIGLLSSLSFGILFSSSLSKTLSEIAQRLGSGAQEVASASQQISSSGAELSASATEQAAALQETVASVDEVSAMVNKNADNAKQSQNVSMRSHDTAAKGKEAVEEMIHSISEISKSNVDIMGQIEESNRQISEIVKVIGEIGNKTKVINDIVFQTKLLSFNASVEAARAGEHGKGFAVVAEEVGNLAQMSGNAAKEISQMLESSIHKVESIVNETKSKVEKLIVSGREKVEAGTVTAKHCGEVLNEIVNNVEQVNQMMGEIATASREQAQGIVEINKAMGQLDQVTQQNASSSQQSASASEQLSSQAEDLREMVSGLLETINGVGQSPSFAQNATNAARGTKNQAKVIEFKRKEKKTTKSGSSQGTMQKASGGDDFPMENDPRFEDV